jgi:hypothetical protein
MLMRASTGWQWFINLAQQCKGNKSVDVAEVKQKVDAGKCLVKADQCLHQLFKVYISTPAVLPTVVSAATHSSLPKILRSRDTMASLRAWTGSCKRPTMVQDSCLCSWILHSPHIASTCSLQVTYWT